MRRLTLFLFLCLCWLPLQAAQLALILSSEEGPYREFSGTLKGAIGGSSWKIAWQGGSEDFAQTTPPGIDLVIAVGSSATRAALQRPDGPPVIATLLTRTAFEKIRSESPVRRGGISALYLDQPLPRQLAFIQRLLPDTRRVMTVVSDGLENQIPLLKRHAAASQMSVDATVLLAGDNLVPVMERMLVQEGVFLALPDSTVFSRDNIRPFLLTTYRYQRPVIAFSPAFVQAGALAALHTTPAQLALELSQWLGRMGPGNMGLPPPQGPSRFSITINSQVARSLKLTLPSETEAMATLGTQGAEK